MEYNSVDKVFADKLRDIEKTPSEDIWNRLQERRQPPIPRASSFPYARVACAALLLVVSTLAWQPVKDSKLITVEQTSRVAMYFPKKQATQIADLAQGSAKSNVNAVPERIADHKEETTYKRVVSPTNVKGISAQELTVARINMPATVSKSAEIASNDLSIAPLVIVVSIADNNLEKSEPAEKNVADISANKEKKTSKASKLFHQLKKIKDGEKVNWKELGISSESVLALVRDDVQHKPNTEK